MTMIAGVCHSTFGLVAFDSRPKVYHEDGAVEYLRGHPPTVSSFPGGWATASGHLHVASAAVERAGEWGGGTLDGLAEWLAPALQVACSEVPQEHQGVDPASTRVLLLTAGSGGVEMGLLTPRSGLKPIPPGNSIFSPPADVPRGAAVARWGEFVEDTFNPGSAYSVLRALAGCYGDVSELGPTLSGNLTLGLLQRPPGGSWETVRLEGSAADLRDAGDSELSGLMRMEVAA